MISNLELQARKHVCQQCTFLLCAYMYNLSMWHGCYQKHINQMMLRVCRKLQTVAETVEGFMYVHVCLTLKHLASHYD